MPPWKIIRICITAITAIIAVAVAVTFVHDNLVINCNEHNSAKEKDTKLCEAQLDPSAACHKEDRRWGDLSCKLASWWWD